MASANCLASGVDHWWPPSVELHLAPAVLPHCKLTRRTLRDSSLAVRDKLVLIVSDRMQEREQAMAWPYRFAVQTPGPVY